MIIKGLNAVTSTSGWASICGCRCQEMTAAHRLHKAQDVFRWLSPLLSGRPHNGFASRFARFLTCGSIVFSV